MLFSLGRNSDKSPEKAFTREIVLVLFFLMLYNIHLVSCKNTKPEFPYGKELSQLW